MEGENSARAFGKEGEAAACAHLEKEGWVILARNFRAGRGEIDVIATRGDIICFVEVKRWRRNGSQDLKRAIGRGKIGRIIETSKIFLAKYRQYRGKQVRYDVFLLTSGKQPISYEGAFDETI